LLFLLAGGAIRSARGTYGAYAVKFKFAPRALVGRAKRLPLGLCKYKVVGSTFSTTECVRCLNSNILSL
jgi:hypothetical protein